MKTSAILVGIAAVIGVAIAVAANLVAEDPSSTVVALVSGAITGIVVALTMRPLERRVRSRERGEPDTGA